MGRDFESYMEAKRRARADRLTDPDECSPDEVEFSVSWREVAAEYLTGSVTATNISQRPWRITGKPVPVQVAVDGHDLPVRHKVSLEGRTRDWIVVKPGAAVQASLSITGWDGTELADYLVIRWPGGRKPATVNGPTHPDGRCEGRAYTSSSWFTPLNLSLGPPVTQMGTHQGNVGTGASQGQNDSAAGLEEIGAFARARLADTLCPARSAQRPLQQPADCVRP